MLIRNLPFRRVLILSLLILILLQKVGYSQNSTTNTVLGKPPIDTVKKNEMAKGQPAVKPPHVIQVLEVFNQKYPDSKDERHNMASIGDIIVVRISNIDSLMRRSKCKDTINNLISGCQVQKISLFINGRMIDNIEPLSGAPQRDSNTGEGELQYRLERNQGNDKVWADVLGSPPFFSSQFFVEPVRISIGLQNEYALGTKDASETNFSLERIHQGWFWACFIGVIIYLSIVFIFLKKSGLLRDRTIDLSSLNIQPSANPPYSLGRFQMAFWFTLFVISFLFIWLITDAYNIITSSVLALIGISAGTSLSAMIIDNNKKQDLLSKTKALKIKMATLDANSEEARQINYEIDGNIKELTPKESENFLRDILEDVNGTSFHRLQMLVWTIVLGLLFIYSVWKRLSMPEFDATLLALQGLTAGTYLGFKFPEKQT